MLWFALDQTLLKPLVWLVNLWEIRERLIGLRSSGSFGIFVAHRMCVLNIEETMKECMPTVFCDSQSAIDLAVH